MPKWHFIHISVFNIVFNSKNTIKHFANLKVCFLSFLLILSSNYSIRAYSQPNM